MPNLTFQAEVVVYGLGLFWVAIAFCSPDVEAAFSFSPSVEAAFSFSLCVEVQDYIKILTIMILIFCAL